MAFKRVGALLALALGALGVVACTAGVYGVWLLGCRFETANERVFAALDKRLASTQERVRGVQKRMKEARISTSEITQSLRDWSTGKAEQRLLLQFEIARRAECLASHLRTADSWLETSTESTQAVQNILEFRKLAGGQVDPASLDDVLASLGSLRNTLQQAESKVDEIRAFAAGKGGESEANRLARATKLLGRIVVTIGELDTRLDEPVARLSELRTDTQSLKTTTSNYIHWTTIGCYAILAWIAAGQIALCRCSWQVGR